MGAESPPETSIRRNLLPVLARLPLFEGLDEASLAAIASELEWFALPGGRTLFEEGDEADALYIVTSGSLGAFRRGLDGRPRLIGRVASGETVGEMALLSGRPRAATVRCLRDSELMCFSKQAFARLSVAYPSAMLQLARLTVARLEASLKQHRPRSAPRTFAILTQQAELDTEGFARLLVAALGDFGRAELLTQAVHGHQTSVSFNEIESRRDFVVSVAGHQPSPWSAQCIRQADALLLLASGNAAPAAWPGLRGSGSTLANWQRADLILMHDGPICPGAASRWLVQQPVALHHHVRGARDVQRIARLLTGRGVGLVLSGGGARGFAHIGVVKALREAGIPIDMVGGTSIGAIIAAGVAAEWDDAQMVERHHRTFVRTSPLADYTLPLVSLVSGRKVTGLLRGEFGASDIEDLPLPFFCVSANLTSGSVTVHRSGELWRWLRASVAIPGVLPPVFHAREIFIDGSTVNHLPVNVMRELVRGPVIGVDVGGDQRLAACDDLDEMTFWQRLRLLRARRAPNIFQILLRAGTLSSSATTAENREQSSILLRPPLNDVDILNWQAFDRAIEAGYRYTLEHVDQIRAALTADAGTLVV